MTVWIKIDQKYLGRLILGRTWTLKLADTQTLDDAKLPLESYNIRNLHQWLHRPSVQKQTWALIHSASSFLAKKISCTWHDYSANNSNGRFVNAKGGNVRLQGQEQGSLSVAFPVAARLAVSAVLAVLPTEARLAGRDAVVMVGRCLSCRLKTMMNRL